MKTDLQRFMDMLESSGYTRKKTVEHDQLGHREYMIENLGPRLGVTLGPGRTRDEDCYTVFYFNLEGGFEEHNSCTDN